MAVAGFGYCILSMTLLGLLIGDNPERDAVNAGVVTPGSAPTATTRPAATATKQAEPTARPTRTAASYMSLVEFHSDEVTNALLDSSDLLSNPRFGDIDWFADIELHATTIEVNLWSMQNTDPPASHRAFHNKWIEGVGKTSQGMNLVVEAIESGDLSRIDEARQLITDGGTIIRQAVDLLPGT